MLLLGSDVALGFYALTKNSKHGLRTATQGNYVYADTPEVIFYHDMNSEAQKKAISALKHQSAAVFTDVVTYEPWHDIECMYFFCDDDRALPLLVQRQMAQMLGPCAATFHSVASHSPFLSQVGDVVKGLEYAADQGQQRVRAGGKLHLPKNPTKLQN